MSINMDMRHLIIIILCCFYALPYLSLASKARHFKWEVGYMYGKPDCMENVVIGINGQFPGPTIRAKVGDTIVVELHNKLHTEGVVIHWHRIRQFGTPWADGTAAISQCAINPEEMFVYRFKVDKSLLINGVGQYNCSLASHFSNGEMGACETSPRKRQCKANVISVLPNKTYRLRVASTTALLGFEYGLRAHLKSTIFEID